MKNLFVAGAMLATLWSAPAVAQKAKASKGQQMQQQAQADVPRCARKLGTVAIENGENAYIWEQNRLGPPARVLRALVLRSGCFNIVDRGAGLDAAARERSIGGDLGLQRRSNVGRGQIRAADYVLIAEVQGADENVGGSGIAGGIGGLIDRRVGGLLGGIKSKKLEANTVLTLTNVRTTETLAVEEGYAAKNNLSFGGGGFFAIGGAIGGGYDDTDIGRIVTLSFIEAYSKLVENLGLVREGDEGTAEAGPTKTFSAQGNVMLRATASAKGRLIRTLPSGSIVYPTGKQSGLRWEVADENDNVGWVINTRLAPSN